MGSAVSLQLRSVTGKEEGGGGLWRVTNGHPGNEPPTQATTSALRNNNNISHRQWGTRVEGGRNRRPINTTLRLPEYYYCLVSIPHILRLQLPPLATPLQITGYFNNTPSDITGFDDIFIDWPIIDYWFSLRLITVPFSFADASQHNNTASAACHITMASHATDGRRLLGWPAEGLRAAGIFSCGYGHTSFAWGLLEYARLAFHFHNFIFDCRHNTHYLGFIISISIFTIANIHRLHWLHFLHFIT